MQWIVTFLGASLAEHVVNLVDTVAGQVRRRRLLLRQHRPPCPATPSRGCAGRLKRPQTEQQYYPELTGIRSLTERYCRQFRALRSPRDPAPSALWPRWGFGGAARRRHQPNGGSQCQSLQSNEQLHHPQRLFRLQILRNRPLTILRLRRPSRARSNLASSPCFNRPRGQRLPR